MAVPNVVGQVEDAAAAELASHDLHGNFAKPGQSDVALVCGGAAPGATVIGQFPDPGAHARSGQKVALFPSAYEQTGCGHPTGLQECDPSQLTLNVSEGKPDYTGGGDDSLAVVKVAHVNGRSDCAVNSSLTMSVERSGAPMNQIAGNPMTLQLHASLAAGDKMVAGWLLGSWCGSRHSVSATANLEGLEARRSLKELPFGGGCPTITLYSLYRD